MTVPSKVHQLPDTLIARIAAGEVIERPASVLKELVENSLDAGATEIRVLIEGAGRKMIRVWDNGEGMTPEDARLCLKRHATSKIKALEDLETIGTFGFRGEALPSIASVSRFTLTTKTAEENSAVEIKTEGGAVTEEKPAARETGTTIEVADLFFNTPARHKFLKTDGTEKSQCLRVMEEISFTAPHAAFHVETDGASSFHFPARAEEGLAALKPRLGEAWGARVANDMIPVNKQTHHFKLSGFASKLGHSVPSLRYQTLFINNRPVQMRRLSRAVMNAYMGSMPVGRYPAWLLYLEVDPRTVDVNVHPAKREVKLTHESELFGFIQSGLKEALAWVPSEPAAPTTAPATFSGFPRPSFSFPSEYPRVRETVDTLYRREPSAAVETSLPQTARPSLKELKPIGQVHRMFIVAESEEGLVLLDQHAAAERVLYEKLLLDAEKGSPARQGLLAPYQWEVARSLRASLEKALPLFQTLGFDMEPFGGNAFLVKAYPAALGEKFDLLTLLDALSDEIAEEGTSVKSEASLRHRLTASAACKGSIRAGDPVSVPEAQALIQSLSNCRAPDTCPHGRPTTQTTSFFDLERRFGRR